MPSATPRPRPPRSAPSSTCSTRQLERLDEQYNVASINLQKADADIKAGEQRLAETKKQLAEDAAQLRSYAVQRLHERRRHPVARGRAHERGHVRHRAQGLPRGGRRQPPGPHRQAAPPRGSRPTPSSASCTSRPRRGGQDRRPAVERHAAGAGHAGAGATARTRRPPDAWPSCSSSSSRRRPPPRPPPLARPRPPLRPRPRRRRADRVHRFDRHRHRHPACAVFVPPPGSGATVAVAAAESQIGVPYVWAGASPGRRVRLLRAHHVGLGPGRRRACRTRPRASTT